ncbi:hypothetical protein MMC19_004465 [Ptychographa xylographoides]|nr:hypothetical protein [Ptychographa xylographoides]
MSTQVFTAPYTRSALSDSTNNLKTQAAATAHPSIKPAQSKSLRHKKSARTFRPQVDSSESLPSSHSSIFEAVYCGSKTDKADDQAPWLDTFVTGGSRKYTPKKAPSFNSLPEISPPAIPPARTIHLPTQLETIKEQKSLGTLRNQPSLLDRRKLSFSLDDLPLFRRHSRLFKNSSSSSSAAIAPPVDQPAIAYPMAPVQEPPPRMPTPPGLPAFNTPAALTYRLPSPNSGFYGLFHWKKGLDERRWRDQTARLPSGVVMRGENGVLVRGRWRPSQSGHTGNVRIAGHRGVGSHALHIAPRANPVPEAGIRACVDRQSESRQMEQLILHDAGSLLVRGSHEPGTEGINQHTEAIFPGSRSPTTQIHDSQNLAGQPQSPQNGVNRRSNESTRPAGPVVEKSSRWFEFVEGFCFICCGAEKLDDGGLHPRIVASNLEIGGLRYSRLGCFS